MAYTQGGFEPRYIVCRADGNPIRSSARYMVMNYDGSDPHAVLALRVYAASVKSENPQLAQDIERNLVDPVNAPPQH